MFKKYWLVVFYADGVLANTCIEGSIIKFLIRGRKLRLTIKSVIPISRREYNEFKVGVDNEQR